MKRIGQLWPTITGEENILAAVIEESYTKRMSRRRADGKTRGEVMRENLKYWVERVKAKMLEVPYMVDPLFEFDHKEGPKLRHIEMHSLVDAIAIRAMVRVVEPIIYARMTPHSYCPIKGRGPLKLARRIERDLKAMKRENEVWMKYHPKQKRRVYCLKTDIKKFFPSIAQDVAVSAIGRWIKDKEVLRFISTLIANRKGIPIGSGYSAMIANAVMLEADWEMASFIGVLKYYRYMDDVVMLFRSKEKAHAAHEEYKRLLFARGLSDEGKWQIFDVAKRPITLGGFKIRPTGVHIAGRISRHILKIFRKGFRAGWERIANSQRLALASLYGWIISTDSFNFKLKWRKYNADRVLSLIGLSARSSRERAVQSVDRQEVDGAIGCDAYKLAA